jgi:hypothetical protein
VAENSRLLLPLRRASATIFSAVRFLTQGYDTMLGVLDDLKAKQAMPAAKPPKPARK